MKMMRSFIVSCCTLGSLCPAKLFRDLNFIEIGTSDFNTEAEKTLAANSQESVNQENHDPCGGVTTFLGLSVEANTRIQEKLIEKIRNPKPLTSNAGKVKVSNTTSAEFSRLNLGTTLNERVHFANYAISDTYDDVHDGTSVQRAIRFLREASQNGTLSSRFEISIKLKDPLSALKTKIDMNFGTNTVVEESKLPNSKFPTRPLVQLVAFKEAYIQRHSPYLDFLRGGTSADPRVFEATLHAVGGQEPQHTIMTKSDPFYSVENHEKIYAPERTFGELVDTFQIRSVKFLKVDAEMLDCRIVLSMLRAYEQRSGIENAASTTSKKSSRTSNVWSKNDNTWYWEVLKRTTNSSSSTSPLIDEINNDFGDNSFSAYGNLENFRTDPAILSFRKTTNAILQETESYSPRDRKTTSTVFGLPFEILFEISTSIRERENQLCTRELRGKGYSLVRRTHWDILFRHKNHRIRWWPADVDQDEQGK